MTSSCLPVTRYVCTYVFVCTFVLYSIDVDRVVQDVDYLFTDILPYCLPNIPFVIIYVRKISYLRMSICENKNANC